MTILVTGSAGFIGSHIVQKLLEKGEKIIGVDNFDMLYEPSYKLRNISEFVDNKNFIFKTIDFRNFKDVESLFKEYPITKIIHLGARAGVRPSIDDPFIYQDINVKGTLNLLELARLNKIQNFIFASSSSVYGNSKKVPFNEMDSADRPISPYAASKRAAELLCFNYSHLYNIPVSCLRFFTVYGPRQRPEMAIASFTKKIDEGKEISLYGDGDSSRDYTYIDDITDGILKALNKKFSYEIINLGNSNPIKLKYLVSLIEKELGKKAVIKFLPKQAGDVETTYADISKAQKLLEYKPSITIEEGIKRYVVWYKKNK
ncbi:GDP-L-fucose synthase [Candidatus Tiddalikarchaeum anstoanum]|nr:GDP-L-fucose synthase [Candidatus Tiddalikarchaeum anstoanum]